MDTMHPANEARHPDATRRTRFDAIAELLLEVVDDETAEALEHHDVAGAFGVSPGNEGARR